MIRIWDAISNLVLTIYNCKRVIFVVNELKENMVPFQLILGHFRMNKTRILKSQIHRNAIDVEKKCQISIAGAITALHPNFLQGLVFQFQMRFENVEPIYYTEGSS